MSFDAALNFVPLSQMETGEQHTTRIANGAPSLTSLETFESGPCTSTPLVDPSEPAWNEVPTGHGQRSPANSDGMFHKALSPAQNQFHGVPQPFTNVDHFPWSDEFDDSRFDDQFITDSWKLGNAMNYDHYTGDMSPVENLKHVQHKNIDISPNSVDRGLDFSHDPKVTSTWVDGITIEEPYKRKVPHYLVERRYRESLKDKYKRLENVLSHHNSRSDPSRTKTGRNRKQIRRPTILENACTEIQDLLSEVAGLDRKLKILWLAACSDPHTATYNFREPNEYTHTHTHKIHERPAMHFWVYVVSPWSLYRVSFRISYLSFSIFAIFHYMAKLRLMLWLNRVRYCHSPSCVYRTL